MTKIPSPQIDDEEFWLSFIRRTNSNLAVEGFAHIEELIAGDRLDESTLNRLSGALRSLSQMARTKAALLEDMRKHPWEYRT